MSQQENKDERINNPGGGSVNINRFELSDKTLSIIALVFAVSALVTSIIYGSWAKSESQKAERETRILQQIVQDQSALMVREGLKTPSDDGPLHLGRK